MRRRDTSTDLPEESVLKVDKDCNPDAALSREYVRSAIEICRNHGLQVLWIKATQTAHGRHFYVRIDPPVKAHTANGLQFLLGDDSKRFDFNRARIRSGLPEWNKLFESARARLRTVYQLVTS
jgi:hypothetical protein